MGVVHISYDSPLTHHHFVGSKIAVMYVGPLVGYLPAILTVGSLSDSRRLIAMLCHTAAILDAAHGNIQQPAHNLVNELVVHRAIICFPYIISSEY